MSVDAAVDADWVEVGQLGELFSERDCRGVEVGGRSLGLFRVGSEVFALDNICSHGHAHLSEGELDGFEIECPLHAGLFDVRSGKALCAPLTRDVARYDVAVDGSRVLVRLSA